MDGSDEPPIIERVYALLLSDFGMTVPAAIASLADEGERQGIETRMAGMSADDPHHLDRLRRRVVHSRQALRYPARLMHGTHATTFMALRPVGDDDVPCRVDLRKHGIDGGQGYYATSHEGAAGEGVLRDLSLKPLARGSVLRLFGLAGTGHGELVADLGTILANAWTAAGLGGHMSPEDLTTAARDWEAERLAHSGLAELRTLLPSRFADATATLAVTGTSRKVLFGDVAINLLVRDTDLCDFVATLGGLAPLRLERGAGLDHSAFATPAEYVHHAMGGAIMPGGRPIGQAEAEWLHRTFGEPGAMSVDASLAVHLISYRRTHGFRELGGPDRLALGGLMALAGLAGTDRAHAHVLELMGDLGGEEGMPADFLSGVELYRDATGITPELLATRLSADAHDMADAIWNALGSQTALAVAGLRTADVFPMLLWDDRDPAARTFMDGVERLATAATFRGNGSAGLLAATDLWIRAGRPGHEAGRLGGIGRRRGFREIDFAKDMASVEYAAILGFLKQDLGLGPQAAWTALARKVSAMGHGTHARWLRGEYPEPVPDDSLDPAEPDLHLAEAVLAEEPAIRHDADPGTADNDTEPTAAPGPWWRRAISLSQVLSGARHG